MITDISLCFICTWIAFTLRLEEIIVFKDINFYSALISVFIAVPIFWLFGLYKTILRYSGLSIIFNISISTCVYGMLYFVIIGLYSIEGIPRSIGIIQPMILLLCDYEFEIICKACSY